ncbi:GlsB/YeaQ/YmgE family stress response membrane protein [Chitinimonas lacunae]|uniref:GlsB/YeaQ/YmgE family stress response membrane protein n=1 Tax=Chitinimonas lacunae TaxID=1963018 RepID=A0ABV8MRQ9_9NEIS
MIWSIIIGFVVGLIARALMPGPNPMGIILTTVLGIIGALLASFVGRTMGWYDAGESAGIVAAIIGSIGVLAIYGAVTRGRGL